VLWLAIASPGLAQCTAPATPPAANAAGWTWVAEGVGVGPCEPEGATCIRVGARTCELPLPLAFDSGVVPSLLVAGSARLLVLRWSDEHGGDIAHDASGIEVWTTEAMPRRIFAGIESSYDALNIDPGDTRVLCELHHAITVDAVGITVGPRSTEGDCHALLRRERVGTRSLPARGGRWTWAALLGPRAR
jgi:hypothetical protein